MHSISLVLQEDDNARQYVVIATEPQTQQKRQVLDGAEVKLDVGEIGPVDAADDHQIAAAVLLKGCEQLAHLAPFHPGVGKARYACVSLATDADDVHLATLCGGGRSNRAGQRAPAGNDCERTRAVAVIVALPAAGINFGSRRKHH